MYALVDCNNFYCSCERVFQPEYNNVPVIVLSNNDGCAVARSEEAKALGIEMGAPLHLIRDVVAKHKVKVFSSNYTLYGDMSRRVYSVYDNYSAHIENYSIDESFLFLGNMPFHSLNRIAVSLRGRVQQWTGIPVSVGLARTQTLAKLANRYAKKVHRAVGFYSLDTKEKVKEVLQWCDIGDVWGIGPAYAAKLRGIGVHTAYAFTLLPEEWIRKEMTVVGQRMYHELREIPCIKFEEVTPAKKNICTSHQFGSLITDKEKIKQAVANHAVKCARKLRRQNSCAGLLKVFLYTNEFRQQDRQFHKQISIQIPSATNHTNLLLYYAMTGVDMLYKSGYNFHKAGVIVEDLVPDSQVQTAIWDSENKLRNAKVMKALDGINGCMGGNAVRFARQSGGTEWKLRTEYISKRFTTRLEEIIRIKD